MKKMLALMLMVFLFVPLLGACSPEDIGYLEMSMAVNAIKKAEVEGSFVIDLNQTEGDLAQALPFQKLEFTIDGNVDATKAADPYCLLNLGIAIDNASSKSMGRILMTGNKIYSDIAYFKAAFDLAASFGEMDETEAASIAKLFEELEGKDYWISLLPDAEDVYDVNYPGDFMDAYMQAMNSIMTVYQDPAFLQSVKDFYVNAFSGLDSKVVKKIEDGYQISMDTAVLKDLLIRTLEYTATHIDQVLDGYMGIFDKMFLMETFVGVNQQDTEMAREFLKDPNFRKELKTGLEEIVTQLKESGLAEEWVSKTQGSVLNMELTKKENSYISKYDIKAAYEGKALLNMTIESKTKEAASFSRMAAPQNVITMAEFIKRQEKIAYEMNPVSAAVITWENYDPSGFNYADITLIKEAGIDWDWDALTIEDGVAYMPVATVCAMFGEDYAFDSAAGQLYLVRDAKVAVDHRDDPYRGVLLPLRELRKLGYSVAYSPETEETKGYVVITGEGLSPYDPSGLEDIVKTGQQEMDEDYLSAW